MTNRPTQTAPRRRKATRTKDAAPASADPLGRLLQLAIDRAVDPVVKDWLAKLESARDVPGGGIVT